MIARGWHYSLQIPIVCRNRKVGTRIARPGGHEREPSLADISRPPEQHNASRDPAVTDAADTARLLAGLSPHSDLAWLVERVSRTKLPWVVIPGTAITRWETRDPAGWEQVSKWLAESAVTIVRI